MGTYVYLVYVGMWVGLLDIWDTGTLKRAKAYD